MSDEKTISMQLSSAADYIAALDTICALTKHTLLMFEKDFSNIGFDSPERFELLRKFLLSNPNNKLQLLAHDTRPIAQYYPRLMSLFRQFGHNMQIFQTPKNLKHLIEPFAISDESHYLRRFHFDSMMGILVQNDAGNARLYKSRFMEMWQTSHPSVQTNSFSL